MSGIKELWTLRILHDYFRNGISNDIDAQLTMESTMSLKRRGILWRKTKTNEWTLFSINSTTFEKDDKVIIELSSNNQVLPYVTDIGWGNRTHQLTLDIQGSQSIRMNKADVQTLPTQPNVIYRLECTVGRLGDNLSVTELVFDSSSLYWEYLLIPRDKNLDRDIFIEDQAGCLSFGPCKRSVFSNIELLKIRSKEKIKLEEYPQYDLKLYEKVRDITRMIKVYVSIPVPGKNISDSKDTIQSILYI